MSVFVTNPATWYLTSSYRKRTHILRVVGQYVAKAMLDSRIIDLSVNKIFVKLVLGEEVPLTIESLKVRSFLQRQETRLTRST